MGWFGKKKTKEEPDGGFKFELFGDDRDENLNQYQPTGCKYWQRWKLNSNSCGVRAR